MNESFTIKDKNTDYNNFNEYIEVINSKNELFQYINGITLHLLCNRTPYENILNNRMNIVIDYYIDNYIITSNDKENYINYYKNNIIDNLKDITIAEYARRYREEMKLIEDEEDTYSVDSDALMHYRSKFPTQEMLKEYYQNLYKRQNYNRDDSDYEMYSDILDNQSECESYYSYNDYDLYDEQIDDELNNDYYSDDEY